jgi:acyl carrier protein
MKDPEEIIHQVLLGIVQQKAPSVTKLANENRLTGELGLKSLEIARLVALLELELDVDPFAHLVAITDVRTVEDLCRAYRRALSAEQGAPSPAEAEPSSQPAGNRRQAGERRRRSLKGPE